MKAGLGGADRVIRTPDLRITNAPLYQLSYAGTWKGRKYMQILHLVQQTQAFKQQFSYRDSSNFAIPRLCSPQQNKPIMITPIDKLSGRVAYGPA